MRFCHQSHKSKLWLQVNKQVIGENINLSNGFKDQSRRNAKRSFLVNMKPKFVDYNKKSNFKARKEKETKQIKNKIESKQLIENLDLLNSNLQSKVNYFYQPYKCKEMKNYLIPMNFEEAEADINYCRTPQNDKKWRKVSNFLLKKETLYLREYLKYVNPDMYNELKKIGCDILEGKDHKGEEREECRSLSPVTPDKNKLNRELFTSKKEFQQNISKLMARRILGNDPLNNKKLRVLSCNVEDESKPIDDSIVSPLLSIMRTKNTLRSEKNSPAPKAISKSLVMLNSSRKKNPEKKSLKKTNNIIIKKEKIIDKTKGKLMNIFVSNPTPRNNSTFQKIRTIVNFNNLKTFKSPKLRAKGNQKINNYKIDVIDKRMFSPQPRNNKSCIQKRIQSDSSSISDNDPLSSISDNEVLIEEIRTPDSKLRKNRLLETVF